MNLHLLVLAWMLGNGQASPPNDEARIRQLVSDIARSGRVLTIASDRDRLADPRKQIAPGAPPLLSFRYFEGADRHRFGKLDVMMDDAGH
jgi:hypothetical protein